MTKAEIKNAAHAIQAKDGGSYLDALETIKAREEQGAHECVGLKASQRRMDRAILADELIDAETLRMEQRHGIGPRSDRSHDGSDYRAMDEAAIDALTSGLVSDAERERMAAARAQIDAGLDAPLTDPGDAFFVPAPEDRPDVADQEYSEAYGQGFAAGLAGTVTPVGVPRSAAWRKGYGQGIVKRHRENATAMRVATNEATLRNEREANERAGWVEAAHALGVEHAKNAATWTTDGNGDVAERRRVLDMLRDGDGAAYDYLPVTPNLSGEFADSLTPKKLWETITGRDADESATDAEWANEIEPLIVSLCDAYDEGVSETFSLACEAELIKFVGELSGTFTLTLKLGNEAFKTTAELVAMIRDTAQQVEDGETSGIAVEVNGNNVGGFSITEGA